MPYHFVEYCDENSIYHKHVADLVSVISGMLEPGSSVHEVGCGEGLILHLLSADALFVSGNDADSEAVRMARCLHLPVELDSDITKRIALCADAVIFSDSLEHIHSWKEHLEWAKSKSDMVVIAIPDRHDRHGLRDFNIDSFDAIFKDWKCVHRATRHARHLLIFTRET